MPTTIIIFKVHAKRLLALFLCLFALNGAHAQTLSGTTGLACEAILCLSSSTRPGECSPALSHYYGIKKKKLSDTLDARLNFLNQCPVVGQYSAMRSLVHAISRGAGRCDIAALNQNVSHIERRGQTVRIVSSTFPPYCSTYYGHQYTHWDDAEMPVYVGEPQYGGFWALKKDADAANTRYLAEKERRLREERRYNSGYQY